MDEAQPAIPQSCISKLAQATVVDFPPYQGQFPISSLPPTQAIDMYFQHVLRCTTCRAISIKCCVGGSNSVFAATPQVPAPSSPSSCVTSLPTTPRDRERDFCQEIPRGMGVNPARFFREQIPRAFNFQPVQAGAAYFRHKQQKITNYSLPSRPASRASPGGCRQ
ncbi:hypothetical protein LZ31DRAFT_121879 [Colletotrichum somersetense]|nr:hypothetical protein LZ31DRAFT_121879 [Colletotrichum somersetense]